MSHWLFQTKTKRGLRMYFSELPATHWKFSMCHFYPYKFQKKQAFTLGNPTEILQNCETNFGDSKVKAP